MSRLTVEGLSGGYGKLRVLHDVGLEVESGELLLLAGPNGAGKSTLLSFMMGVRRAEAGRVTLGATDLSAMGVRDRMRAGLAIVPEGRGLFPSLTVRENLRVAGSAMGIPKASIEDAIARAVDAFPIIGERLGQQVGQLSGGQQQMVAVGRGLMADPRVLLLDEPSMGLAPIIWREVLESCQQLARDGRIVVLVEQRILDAIAAADRCVVLQQGRVVRAGPASELAQDDGLFHDYVTARAR
jgi:branched-chain amino acid transport system ATP-binding protein